MLASRSDSSTGDLKGVWASGREQEVSTPDPGLASHDTPSGVFCPYVSVELSVVALWLVIRQYVRPARPELLKVRISVGLGGPQHKADTFFPGSALDGNLWFRSHHLRMLLQSPAIAASLT